MQAGRISCGLPGGIGCTWLGVSQNKASSGSSSTPTPCTSSTSPLWSSSIPLPGISPGLTHMLPLRSGCCQLTPVSRMAIVTDDASVRTDHPLIAQMSFVEMPLVPLTVCPRFSKAHCSHQLASVGGSDATCPMKSNSANSTPGHRAATSRRSSPNSRPTSNTYTRSIYATRSYRRARMYSTSASPAGFPGSFPSVHRTTTRARLYVSSRCANATDPTPQKQKRETNCDDHERSHGASESGVDESDPSHGIQPSNGSNGLQVKTEISCVQRA